MQIKRDVRAFIDIRFIQFGHAHGCYSGASDVASWSRIASQHKPGDGELGSEQNFPAPYWLPDSEIRLWPKLRSKLKITAFAALGKKVKSMLRVSAIYTGVLATAIASSAWAQVNTQKNTETRTASPSSNGIVLAADSATAEDRNRINDDPKIVWPEKHAFKSCFRTNFTTQVKGRTYGKPSTWVSQYQTLSTSATDENYIFCFPERGVSGSAMYNNGTWIYFQRNHFGRLHGDIERGKGNVTRFIYFQATGADYAPTEGVSTLYVVLNAKQTPGDNMNPNVIVLTGQSRLIPVAGQ